MTVRFEQNSLVNSEGEQVDVSYEALREECIKNITTLSTAQIISKAVETLTGLEFNRYNYRASSLFNRLETAVKADEQYKKLKQQKNGACSKTTEGKG